MRLNFRKYSRTLAVFRDFELSFLWTKNRDFFCLTRIPSKNPPKEPNKKGWVTKDIETIEASSIWGIQEKMKELGFEVVTPNNWPDLPSNWRKGLK